MIYQGHVKGRTVILDEDVNLPDGTPVTIQARRHVSGTALAAGASTND